MEVYQVIMLLILLIYLFFILLYITLVIRNGDINFEPIETVRRYLFNQDEHQDEDQETTIENAQYMVTRPNIENTNVLRRRSSDALYWI